MLKSARVGEWRVLCEAERAEALLRLFERLVADDWTGVERLEFASTTGRVFKIRTAAGTFVFKHERREHHSADHRWQSFFFGSNTRRLIRALDRAGARNFPAAEVFLAADRYRFGSVVESYLIAEFVEGETLGRVPGYREKYGAEVAALLARLHAAGLVHGDVHERNFVLGAAGTPYAGRVVGIDLSGKRSTRYTRAEDRIRLRRTFGVENPMRDFGARLFELRVRLRNFFRRLRGRAEINAELLLPAEGGKKGSPQ